VVVIAIGAVASTIADKLALELLPRGLSTVARYSVWEATAALPFLWPMTASERAVSAREGLGWVVVAAAFSCGSYALVLVAYQFTDHTSIIAAIRQLSIPIGVALSSSLLKERPSRARWIAASTISVGVACVVAGA
jgi:drug/metabolite transporter (DMT)-like permease